MTEIAGPLWLSAAVAAVAVGAGLAACCLRVRSPSEFLLAAYVLAWSWLVGLTLLLSPVGLVTRGWLGVGIGAGVVVASAAWLARKRPSPPEFGDAITSVRAALRRSAVLVLVAALVVGLVYSAALALFIPANDGDALAYHLPRAAFWRQEHQLGYVANAEELRLNVNPPNAEIGQLATMLVSGTDRYVALPQLAAYGALVLCVVSLARRAGFTHAESLFGALAFATLPVVLVQASSALNDLVVASFLAAAAVFALGRERAYLVLVALALGLAIGTKFTALLALPALAAVIAVGSPTRRWPGLAIAGVAGIALGSPWYVLNLAKTGQLDGGLGEQAEQRVELEAPAIVTEALRYSLDLVDMSGAFRPHSLLYLGAACVLAGIGLRNLRRSFSRFLAFAGAAVVTASIYLAPRLATEGQDFVIRAWAALGRPETAPFEFGWGLNVQADPAVSWYGPLGTLLLAAGSAVVVFLWARGRLSTTTLGFVATPWVVLLTLSASIVWDPFRGRFLIFAVALAAAAWGLLLRWPAAAGAVAAVGTTSLALALANYVGKPSGLGETWPPDEKPFVTLRSIWGSDRADAQARLRPDGGELAVYRFLERRVPADARVTVAPRENDFLFPYFGSRLSRHVQLVQDGRTVTGDTEWLIIPPAMSVDRCRAAWEPELELDSGWRIERRIGPDTCQ